jgi:hypothetical protein
MLDEELPTVFDALNEYFRLKGKFENDNKVIKKKIINNQTLSKREKRTEFLKLRPKCVNCKRPSKLGTIFTMSFYPDNDTDGYRKFKASCGDLSNPCNLNIEIDIGKYESIEQLMNDMRNDINNSKNEIIIDKNNLLFGLVTTETAIENFDTNKSYINSLTSLYEKYLDEWNKIVDNQTKNDELEESLIQSYQAIAEIKQCINRMNENDDVQYAVDAANIYHNTLHPLLKKIRTLKYSVNYVYNDENTDNFKLIQQKYGINDILVTGFNNKLLAYDIGLKAKKSRNKKPLLLIESDESKDKDEKEYKERKEYKVEKEYKEEEGEPKFKISIKETQNVPSILFDEPIIGKGKDGIEWNEPKYKYLWSKLPPKLKDVFKLNIDWMKEFMNKCVNEQIKHGPNWNGCKLTIPPNIIIPPRKVNEQYDFGVTIYNTVFNKLPKSLQDTYLTFYKEDPSTKRKDYKQLEEELNRLVERELDFGRGFF